MIKFQKIGVISKEIISRKCTKTILVFLLFLVINSLIYFSVPSISSFDDQWFHFKVADMVREDGFSIVKNFKWIYFTNLAQDGKNYGLTLFHVFIIPFTFFSNKILGLKILGIFFASIFPAVFYYVLNKFKIKNSFFWILFFFIFAGFGFYYRMFIARNYILTESLFLLEILFVYKRKYFWLFWLAILHTWWHMATFWIVPIVVVVFELVRNINGEKISFKNIISGISGSILGFLFLPLNSDHLFASINPIAWTKDVFKVFYNIKDEGIIAGVEGYKADFFSFLSGNHLFLFIFSLVSVFVIYSYINKKRGKEEKNNFIILRESLFIICLGFFLGTIAFSSRFSDFLFPVTFLLFILIINYVLKNNFLLFKNKIFLNSIKISSLIFILILFLNLGFLLRQRMSSTPDYGGYKKVGEWFKNNTKERDIIFNTKWDQFPMLFFYNSWNYYIIGIEPRALNRYNPNLYWLWHNIVYNGVVCDENRNCDEILEEYNKASDEKKDEILLSKSIDIARVVKDNFKSEYVFTDKKTSPFLIKELEKSTNYFERLYFDEENSISVYKVK